jgi:putative DNA methylase
LAQAIFGAGFHVVNSQPVKAEMSVATPKSQAKEPIQLDIIVVCRKVAKTTASNEITPMKAIEAAKAKLERLRDTGLVLSRNDRKIVLFGQLLTTLSSASNLSHLVEYVEAELRQPLLEKREKTRPVEQPLLFGGA